MLLQYRPSRAEFGRLWLSRRTQDGENKDRYMKICTELSRSMLRNLNASSLIYENKHTNIRHSQWKDCLRCTA